MVTYPLNNIQYTAEDAELYNSTRTSGVFADDSFNYSVTGANNTIVIGTGIAWIKNGEFSGKVVAQKEALSLNLGLSNANYPRIDAVVIKFNANSNSTEIIVKKGTASSRPSAPAVVRTESVYELHLYHVHRNAGELSVSPSSITDLRGNDEYCGIMTDGVTKIDKTLTKDGYVADAKAVGDAISSATNISVPNTRTINGFRLNKNISLSSKDVGSAPAVESEEHSGCYYRMVGGTKEWVNPPMIPGVEYRTTERWNSKVVYVKYIAWTYGNMIGDASTYKDYKYAHGIDGLAYCVRVEATFNAKYMLPYVTSAGGWFGVIEVNDTNLVLRALKDTFSSPTLNAYVYYTKE